MSLKHFKIGPTIWKIQFLTTDMHHVKQLYTAQMLAIPSLRGLVTMRGRDVRQHQKWTLNNINPDSTNFSHTIQEKILLQTILLDKTAFKRNHCSKTSEKRQREKEWKSK
jgi:hypothetical protein